ncbi:MAG: GNAT family N-acetyltransferase [Pseudomonadales bacterium]|nr:GNAT family N-acetyltransferase [Pseudomonadales bacterium]
MKRTPELISDPAVFITPDGLTLRHAVRRDAAQILEFVRALAAYERLSDEVCATLEDIENSLFGEHVYAEVVIAEHGGQAVGFVLFFPNYSTFLGKPGIHIEDLFVQPEMRGHGFGRTLLAYIAHLAEQRGWGRVEWSVLDWNQPAIDFYQSIGAATKNEWLLQRLSGEALKALAHSHRATPDTPAATHCNS